MDRMEENVAEEESRMEVEVEPEEVVLGSDESSEDEDVIPVHQTRFNPRLRPTPNRGRVRSVRSQHGPVVVDLTKDDENDNGDDDIMVTGEEDNKATRSNASVTEPDVIEVDADPIPVPVPPKEAKETAEDRKKKGNDHFKLGEYYQALAMYTKAIEAMPEDASYYGNRSACYMMLKRHREALSDIRKSIFLDPCYSKGYLRLVRTTLALGNIKECEMAFNSIELKNVDVDVKLEAEKLTWLKNQLREIDTTTSKKDFRKLVYLTTQALDVATANNELKMIKADALLRLGRHSEAQELCTEVLQNDVQCVEALYTRAMCWYLDDNIDKSIQFVRQGLQYAPDNSSCQKLLKKLKQVKELRESASSKFSSYRFDEAKADYMQCLSIVGNGDISNVVIQSKLYFNLALIAHKKHQLDESLEACGKAIELNSNYVKAIIHRARLYTQLEKHDDAIHDYESALRIDPSLKGLKKDLQDAKMASKRAKRKDYYKILNISKNASVDEIRKAYKLCAFKHHPDRHVNATEAVKKEEERLFKELGEAYEVLNDPKKRLRYDQGVDLMDDRGGYDPSSFDNSDFINIFFGGGGGGIPSYRPNQAPAGGARGPNQFHYTFR